MKTTRVAIIGSKGVVGSEMVRLFTSSTPHQVKEKKSIEVIEHDKEDTNFDEVNSCDIAFVCVPTPMGEDGHCNTSIVEEVMEWLKVETVVIRSTVPPGISEWFDVVFQPEYIGETPNHNMSDSKHHPFLILGGPKEQVDKTVEIYQKVYNANVRILKTDSRTAEVIKYMENSFIATKVTFCNEFYDVCETMEVDYDVVREGFLLDPRMSRDFTFVYPDKRGWGGSCLPKDISAIIKASEDNDYDMHLMKSVQAVNKIHNDKNL
jgi:UDPglucose 6-dehydrogenase